MGGKKGESNLNKMAGQQFSWCYFLFQDKVKTHTTLHLSL
jgi:hypothetical protein